MSERHELFGKKILGTALALLAIGLAPLGCDDAGACKSKADCQKLGKCTPDEKGLCAVVSSEDCAGSEQCKLHGRCHAEKGACVAASSADCKASEDCQKAAACDAYQGSCVDLGKSVHAECTKTCESEGRCVMKDGKCSAVSRRHCAGTLEAKAEPESPCGKRGQCTPDGGRCVASTNEDCAASAACKNDAHCHVNAGGCVALADDCKNSPACSNGGKCDAKEGQCVATSSADCKKAARCKLEGACSVKDGACVALTAGDCQQSSVCAQAKHCTPRDGACVGSGSSGGSAAGGPAPDKVGPSTISGIF